MPRIKPIYRLVYVCPEAKATSTAINWPQQELRKEAIKRCIIDDLSMLRELSIGPIRAHCTNQAAARMLRAADFAPDNIICWGAHPSKIFHPSTLYRSNLCFKAQEKS